MKSVMEMTLMELCKVVAARWPFDGKSYEELARTAVQVSAEEYEALRLKFAIEHIHKHLSDVVGSLGKISEKFDHEQLGVLVRSLGSPPLRTPFAMVASDLVLATARLIEIGELNSALNEEFFFWASKHQLEPSKE